MSLKLARFRKTTINSMISSIVIFTVKSIYDRMRCWIYLYAYPTNFPEYFV